MNLRADDQALPAETLPRPPRLHYEDEFRQDQLMALEREHCCPLCGAEVGERNSPDGDMYECLTMFGGCNSRIWLDAPDSYNGERWPSSSQTGRRSTRS